VKALQIKIEMAQANGPTNNQQQACEITIQGLWTQTGKFFVLYGLRVGERSHPIRKELRLRFYNLYL